MNIGDITEMVPRRTVSRVETKSHMGPDTQVDDRNAIIAPTDYGATDPFILFAEDWFSTAGFEWHPHRGLETVTFVVDGVLEHGDNLGNAGALTTGDVQWMTAGRGIIHRELAYRGERAHILQLWVNLPSGEKMVPTRYQDLRAVARPVAVRDGVRVEVISGEALGTKGLAQNHWPITGALVTMEPNRRYDHVLAAHDRAFFYVMSGTVVIAGRAVRAGQVAWSEPIRNATASVIDLATGDGDEPSVVLTYAGQPIGEPIAMGGPFVMNTKAEIVQAFRDLHAGKFGSTPRLPRL